MNDQQQTFPGVLDVTRLPVSHNHIIGPIQSVSLDNIRGSLVLIQRIVLEADGAELYFSEEESQGLDCLLQNIIQALRFEQYHRQQKAHLLQTEITK